jgi:hypothetical protein
VEVVEMVRVACNETKNTRLPKTLQAWKWSLASDSLCSTQSLSGIFLIPDKDKDKTNVKNWRPVTLSNCDTKMITKAYTICLNSVIEEVIHNLNLLMFLGSML